MSSVPPKTAVPTKAAPLERVPVTVSFKKPVDEKPSDIDIPVSITVVETAARSYYLLQENYVEYTIRTQKVLPPVTAENWWKELNYISAGVIVFVPLITLYGAFTVPLQQKTAVFSVLYYFFTGLGELSTSKMPDF
jgi:hypothetical protein